MSNHINREFRKIKSLNFLYEVNDDGTVLRNVKSKKHIKIILDYHYSKNGYYIAFVNFKCQKYRVFIHRIVAECWLGDRISRYKIQHIDGNSRNNIYTNLRYISEEKNTCIKKSVILQKENFKQQFESYSECARFLAEQYDKSFEHMRGKLKSHRKHIYDYDVIYLNAETKHNDPQR